MATFNWFGGTGRYSGTHHWDPRGVPGPGDTAVVAGGEAVLLRQDVQATVLLGGNDAGSQPVLDLRNSSLGTVTMPDNLVKPVDMTVPIPPEYGTINVWGQSSIGAITLGDYEAQRRVPPPYGHPSIGAPETLAVNLNGRAALCAGFDVKYGSTLTISGGARSAFVAADSTIEAGRVVINAPLAGQGTISMIAGPTTYTLEAEPGSLELGGRVGRWQHHRYPHRQPADRQAAGVRGPDRIQSQQEHCGSKPLHHRIPERLAQGHFRHRVQLRRRQPHDDAVAGRHDGGPRAPAGHHVVDAGAASPRHGGCHQGRADRRRRDPARLRFRRIWRHPDLAADLTARRLERRARRGAPGRILARVPGTG